MVCFDQHLHTERYSPDSIIDPLEMLDQMRRIGLDGVVITEHDRLWPEDELDELRAASGGLRIFSGVEISAREGHFLVYGLPDLRDVEPGIPLRDLVRVARGHDAAIVAAHPFRWDQDFDRIVRVHGTAFDALELVSNNVTPENRQRTGKVCDALGLGRTGSSDAHVLETLGCYYTEYPEPINDIRDLINALRRRAYRPRHRRGAALASGPVD